MMGRRQTYLGRLRWVSASAALAWVLAAGVSWGATYNWNGLGVSGGTSSSNWLDAANWFVGGSPPALPPTTNDTVVVNFNQSYTASTALEVPAGAEGGDVSISGLGNIGTSGFLISGDCTFMTFAYNAGTGENGKAKVNSGVVVSLLGGSESTPSFKEGAGHDFGSGGGTWLFLGSNVYVSVLGTSKSLPGIGVFSNQTGSVNWLASAGQTLAGSFFRFFPSQAVATNGSINGYLRLYGATTPALLSLEGGEPLLTNMASVDVQANLAAGGGGTLYFAGGYYKSLLWRYAGNDNNSYLTRAMGDVTIKGRVSYGDTYITNYSVCIYRSTTSAYVQGGIDFSGKNLTVESSAPVYVGNPGTTGGGSTNRSLMNITNSTVSIAGDLIVGMNGVLVGNAGTAVKVGGNFTTLPVAAVAGYYNMTNSRVIMNGAGTAESPQKFEIRGVDGTGLTTNYAIGALQIGGGVSNTYVALVDDHGGSDVQYIANELTVTNGSTLDFGGKTVYVGGTGVVVRGTVTGSGTIAGNLTMENTATYDITAADAGTCQGLTVTGAVTLAGAFNVTLGGGFATTSLVEFVVIANDQSDPVVGSFSNWPNGALVPVGDYKGWIRTSGGDGNDVVLVVTKITGTVVMVY